MSVGSPSPFTRQPIPNKVDLSFGGEALVAPRGGPYIGLHRVPSGKRTHAIQRFAPSFHCTVRHCAIGPPT